MTTRKTPASARIGIEPLLPRGAVPKNVAETGVE